MDSNRFLTCLPSGRTPVRSTQICDVLRRDIKFASEQKMKQVHEMANCLSSHNKCHVSHSGLFKLRFALQFWAVSCTCTRYSRSWVCTMFSPGLLSLDLDKRFHQSLGSVHLYGRTTEFGSRKREFMTIMCRILRCDQKKPHTHTLTELEPSFRQKSHHFRQRPLTSTYIIQLFAKK